MSLHLNPFVGLVLFSIGYGVASAAYYTIFEKSEDQPEKHVTSFNFDDFV